MTKYVLKEHMFKYLYCQNSFGPIRVKTEVSTQKENGKERRSQNQYSSEFYTVKNNKNLNMRLR